jgi:hypothetical protein
MDNKTTLNCRKCNAIKPIEEVGKQIKNGQSNLCKKCKQEYHNNYKIKNSAKMKETFNKNKLKYYKKTKEKYYQDIELSKQKLKTRYFNNTAARLVNSAKVRAKKKNIPFDITKEDIIIPTFCPVLGIKLQVNSGCAKHSSPSLDRIIPDKGYIKGNVIVVSYKANTIKNDATIEDLEKVTNFYKKKMGEINGNCS